MRIFYFICGLLFCSFFFFLTLLYINLFFFGYTLLEFVYFIIKRGILIYLIIGIILIIWSKKERKK